jgi:hypothetical protein
MKKHLTGFRDRYLDLLLNFLWREWSAIGVSGYGERKDNWVIDPEALLLFSCTIARHEARLFDEIINWLSKNGHYINILRLKTILNRENFSSRKILAPLAEHIAEKNYIKWKRLIESAETPDTKEPLFFFKNGTYMEGFGNKYDDIFYKYGFIRGKVEIRHHTQQIKTAFLPGILLKLRAFFGRTARCEIVAYLLTHESGHPSNIAREVYYAQKTVQDILVEMEQSGFVFVRPVGKEKHYWIKKEKWQELFMLEIGHLKWINWPQIFIALEKIWLKINEPEFLNLTPLLQSSELRQIMHELRPKIESAGFAASLSDDSIYPGESYTGIFLDDMEKILG